MRQSWNQLQKMSYPLSGWKDHHGFRNNSPEERIPRLSHTSSQGTYAYHPMTGSSVQTMSDIHEFRIHCQSSNHHSNVLFHFSNCQSDFWILSLQECGLCPLRLLEYICRAACCHSGHLQYSQAKYQTLDWGLYPLYLNRHWILQHVWIWSHQLWRQIWIFLHIPSLLHKNHESSSESVQIPQDC